ncbi:MAG TPA: MFS transporter [Stellaceae bacterium]
MSHQATIQPQPAQAAASVAAPALPALDPRRWLVLTTLVAAQFMFVVDAFIVNVAIPAIRLDLGASPAVIEAVIALYLIAYATLVITGGRLGDIFGAKPTFLTGLIGFVVASLACGLAQSGPELVAGRLVQGASAALMVPQVLATIHVLFPAAERSRAFGAYGMALGFGGAAGFVLGGFLVTLNLAGLGWRAVFFVNAPAGVAIAWAAWRWMPRAVLHARPSLDIAGAAVLFAGLLCLIGPLLFGGDLGRMPWLWSAMPVGALILWGFLRLERRVERRGGVPLVESALWADASFLRGLAGALCFFLGNLSFYLVVTLFLQGTLGYSPWHAGLAVLPLALAFVLASRQGAARAVRRGSRALVEGSGLQMLGLLGLALGAIAPHPAMPALVLALTLVGYGQGLVMAPLSSAVLSAVRLTSAGSGAGIYATTVQIANAAGVAAVGALFFAVQERFSDRAAFLAALTAVAAAVAAAAVLFAGLRRSAAPSR